MVSGIYFSCQGESHKATDKPCQDFSLSYATSSGIAVAIVCDGHGGERYFRSQYGAKFAAKVTDEAVWRFVQDIDGDLFKGKQYTAVKSNFTGQRQYREANKQGIHSIPSAFL